MSRVRWFLVALLVLTALAGCKQPVVEPTAKVVVVTATPAPVTPTVVPTAVPSVAPTAAPVDMSLTLVVQGETVSRTITLAELKALPVTEGWAGTKSSTGKISSPAYFKGVSVKDLCELIGAFDDTMAANIVAKDGYAMTMSYDQLVNGTFTTFDPATGDEVTRDDKLTMIVAYERDGQPIPEESDGTLRVCIVSANKNQVTDGHWAVKWVREVVVKPAAAEWTLHLEGALVEDMDRGTFESGSAPNCHLAEWADADGNTWAGIPLYFLLGRVDDENKHETGAFNATLAEQGYKVDVVAADGFKATFDSQTLSRNTTIILAFLMNGKPLEDKFFPLRLVGSSLKKNEMVGAVAQIVLHLDEMTAAVATPTAEPTEEAPTQTAPEMAAGTLHIWGKVGSPTAITEAEFSQMDIVKLSVEHPKKGMQDYEGVRLTEILGSAKPSADATVLSLTAGDGFNSEAPLADVLACEDCLVTFDGEAFNLVMPGQSSSAWAKDVRLIEVK